METNGIELTRLTRSSGARAKGVLVKLRRSTRLPVIEMSRDWRFLPGVFGMLEEKLAVRRIGPYTLPNPWVLAPMAGVSEQPFRVLAFRMGAGLCPTELVSAQGLMRANARTVRYLRHDAAVERPYSLQI